MRILILTWRDVEHRLAGGAETYIDRVAAGLQERGHDVTLLAGDSGAERPYRTVDAGGRYTQYLRDPFTVHARLGHHDVIVDVCNGLPFFTPLWTRTPTVLHVHHIHYGMWRQWFSLPTAIVGAAVETKGISRLYSRRLVTTVSPSTERSLVSLGVDPARIRTIPPGVDTPGTVAPRAAAPTFLAVGRLVPHKRHDLLLRAWARVRPQTGGTLFVAGEGPLREQLEQQAPPGTSFLGRVSDNLRDELLASAWFLVQPSRLEGWGLVVAEAAAHRTPALGFWVPGTRDVVVHGETGLLVRSERELIEAWIELARDEEQRGVLAKGARERAEALTWSSTVDSFEAVLVEAVDHARRRVPLPSTARRAEEPAPLRGPASRVVDDVRGRLLLARPGRSVDDEGASMARLRAERAADGLPQPVAGRRLLVLDLGTGSTRLAAALRARGADVSLVEPPTLDGSRPGADVDADVEALPLRDACFDGVVAAGSVLRRRSADATLHEIGRVLRDGGWAHVSWVTGGSGATTMAEVRRAARNVRALRWCDMYPSWMPSQRWAAGVPGVRAVAARTWVLLFEREEAPDTERPLVRPTSTPRALARRSLRRARRLIGNHPVFLPVVLRATPIGTTRAITPSTELVIEGFPRSGNTFAYFAVLEVEPDATVTSRVHTPSQMRLAVRRGIPTLLVVRDPVDCLASNLIASPHVPIRSILEEYVRHHEQVLPLLDHVVVATFEEVTTDFGEVIEALNQRFGLGLRRFVHTPEATEAVFEAIETHHHATWGDFDALMPRPVPEHAGSKARMREELHRLEYGALVALAQTVHDRIASRSVTNRVPAVTPRPSSRP
jgi:glycosyltransferase involved in cell wall biosynthesis/SAM-dependent methyltransferase